MIYQNDLLPKLEDAKKYIDGWIYASKTQHATNFEALYSLQKGLNEFIAIVKNNQDLDTRFIENWNNLWRWVPKFFDGDTFLDLFNSIDKYVP